MKRETKQTLNVIFILLVVGALIVGAVFIWNHFNDLRLKIKFGLKVIDNRDGIIAQTQRYAKGLEDALAEERRLYQDLRVDFNSIRGERDEIVLRIGEIRNAIKRYQHDAADDEEIWDAAFRLVDRVIDIVSAVEGIRVYD